MDGNAPSGLPFQVFLPCKNNCLNEPASAMILWYPVWFSPTPKAPFPKCVQCVLWTRH